MTMATDKARVVEKGWGWAVVHPGGESPNIGLHQIAVALADEVNRGTDYSEAFESLRVADYVRPCDGGRYAR